MTNKKAKIFSLSKYVQKILERAEYYRDENGVVIAKIPKMGSYYAQGSNYEEARQNLQEVIEGNVMLALQLGFPIAGLEDVEVKEVDYAETRTSQTE
jgi:predicted RNase H-like HicB family nuclease